MAQQEELSVSLVRQSTYQLLQQVFTFPEDDFFQLLMEGTLLASIQTITQQLGFGAELVQEFQGEVMEQLTSIDGSKETFLEGLQIDYTKLFISAYPGAVVPPYACKHLKEGPEVVKTPEIFWQRAGVELTSQWRELPDHVVAEFGFMVWLINDEVRTREIQREFVLQHLSHWLPRFLQLVEEEAGTPFYQLLAKFATEFIGFEARHLK